MIAQSFQLVNGKTMTLTGRGVTKEDIEFTEKSTKNLGWGIYEVTSMDKEPRPTYYDCSYMAAKLMGIVRYLKEHNTDNKGVVIAMKQGGDVLLAYDPKTDEIVSGNGGEKTCPCEYKDLVNWLATEMATPYETIGGNYKFNTVALLFEKDWFEQMDKLGL